MNDGQKEVMEVSREWKALYMNARYSLTRELDKNIRGQAFKKGDSSSKGIVKSSDFRGINRGGYGGHGRGRGRGGGRSESDERQNRNLIQWRNCNKYGHKDVDCWSKPKSGSIHCQHCKKHGHRDVDCWSKPKSEQHCANFSEISKEIIYGLFSLMYEIKKIMFGILTVGARIICVVQDPCSKSLRVNRKEVSDIGE
ncbi:retrovirus-related pol polyprotein from transposon TNT 1-94 [Tanacetum coccineum]